VLLEIPAFAGMTLEGERPSEPGASPVYAARADARPCILYRIGFVGMVVNLS